MRRGIAEASPDGITVTWATPGPERGWVEYGAAPDTLDRVAGDVAGNDAVVTNHQVFVPGAATTYYVIVSGGVRTSKEGQPFVLARPAPMVEAADSTSIQPGLYWDAEWGIGFSVPAGWSAKPAQLGAMDDERTIELAGPTGSRLVVSRMPNPQRLTAGAWYAANRRLYDGGRTHVLGENRSADADMTVIGQPDSCTTAPMLAAIFSRADDVIVVSTAGQPAPGAAAAFATVVGSVYFDPAAAATRQVLAMEMATFPAAERSIDCSPQVIGDLAAPAKCAGAAMQAPSPGRMGFPWNCINDEEYCLPYYTGNPDYYGYYGKPHRGLDIFGTIGVTPVYATYSGVVYLYGVSAFRIYFDAPYNDKLAYYTHMAGSSGAPDYRQVVNGQRVAAGQFLGYTGAYGIGASAPHLHVSYVGDPSGSETPWPTLDPTILLSAKNLVWYSGWTYRYDPVTCASSTADLYEPDNLPQVARAMLFSRTWQQHDFHAPGDEDWYSFYLNAGTGIRLVTGALGVRGDTVVEIYGTDRKTLLAKNDDNDGTYASRLDWMAPAAGRYYAKVRHYSWKGYPMPDATLRISYTVPIYGAGSGYSVRMTNNFALDRPRAATTSNTNYPAAKGNDGSTGTRWVSTCSASHQDWYVVDIGSAQFTEVQVNFAAAYAQRYQVAWSDDGVNFTGYLYSNSSSGVKRHIVGAHKARYVGIHLEELAPGACNYSIWEVSVYRRASAQTSGALEEGADTDGVVQQPIGQLSHFVRSDAGRSRWRASGCLCRR
ncbi:MAG: discoidin domain-containing protein [Anaerolineales bacterium]|nr:discoidin domain-containing protein [Anaerolineales bacterium]